MTIISFYLSYSCVCVSSHIFTHVYTYICMYLRTHMYMYFCVCLVTHARMCIHTYVCIYTHTHIYIYICIYIFTYVHIHIYIHICTYLCNADNLLFDSMLEVCMYHCSKVYICIYVFYIYIHIHTYIYLYIYIRTGDTANVSAHVAIPDRRSSQVNILKSHSAATFTKSTTMKSDFSEKFY